MQKINRLLLLGIIVLTVTAGFCSCDRKTIYYHYENTPLAGWEKNDTIMFDVSPVTAGSYRQELGLRIDDDYPFMGLCLVIRQVILPSGYEHSDTLNCSLVDEKGNKKGTGLSCYQYQFHVNTLRLQDGDSLHITVRHNMKREIMQGIRDIGIRMVRE